MSALVSLDIDADRMDMLKWISERNRHIPISELCFMVGVSPFDPDDEEDRWSDDEWS